MYVHPALLALSRPRCPTRVTAGYSIFRFCALKKIMHKPERNYNERGRKNIWAPNVTYFEVLQHTVVGAHRYTVGVLNDFVE